MAKAMQFEEVPCAFCKGVGTDQFDIMSPLSTCVVCGGTGTRRLPAPVARCQFCAGTGVYPQTRLTCTACGGVGMVSIPYQAVTCTHCGGDGRSHDWPESVFYCIHCHGAGVLPG